MVQNLNIFCKLLILIDTHCLNVLLRLFEQDTFKEKTLNRLLLWMGHYVVDWKSSPFYQNLRKRTSSAEKLPQNCLLNI